MAPRPQPKLLYNMEQSPSPRIHAMQMGKEKGSWIRALKKVIRKHIHGDLDEDIVRFPHLPHKKSAQEMRTSRSPPIACCCSAGSSTSSCTCSCGDGSASSQVSKAESRSRRGVDVANSSNGGSLRSINLDDYRSSTGSCDTNCPCPIGNSKRVQHLLEDRRPPTEAEQSLQYPDEVFVNDRETIATLVNLWGPH
ncbi:hypothetical protein R1sor_004928 [Riccia sorocarpa]|uniref:PH domain-containing protein n=1 Tax=Riccia sorocarpa TaxID=122646 RepID=A0ABD3HID4_9MARC